MNTETQTGIGSNSSEDGFSRESEPTQSSKTLNGEPATNSLKSSPAKESAAVDLRRRVDLWMAYYDAEYAGEPPELVPHLLRDLMAEIERPRSALTEHRPSNTSASPTVSEERAVRENAAGAAAIIKRQAAEIEQLKYDLKVQKAVNETAYIPHRSLVESRDGLQKRYDGLQAERDRLRAALKLRDTALRLIKSGPPLRMANDAVASWAAFIASEALSAEPNFHTKTCILGIESHHNCDCRAPDSAVETPPAPASKKDSLSARLTEFSLSLANKGYPKPAALVKEAADEIERLTRERDELTVRLAELARGWTEAADWKTWRDRLRLIVQELVGYAGGMEYDTWRMFVQRAEQALSGEPNSVPETAAKPAGDGEDNSHVKLTGSCDKCRRVWTVYSEPRTDVIVKAFHCPCGHTTVMD